MVKKLQVTVEKHAMREEIDAANEIFEANPLQEDLVEQDKPPLTPIAKQVQFPSPFLNLWVYVVKWGEAEITQFE